MIQSINTFSGKQLPPKKKIALVASRFNEAITRALIQGAEDALGAAGCLPESIHLYWVPGAFEIPLTAKSVAETGEYSVVLCLGAVIRGETPHFDYVAGEAAKGISKASYDTGIPIIFGVLTCDTIDQAIARTGIKHSNKGRDAAASALEMASLLDHINGRLK